MLGVAGALTAAGVVTALSVLRRRQLKRRRPGQAVRRPSPELVPTEIAARALAADAPGPWLDVALRTLSARTRIGGSHILPRPVAVQLGGNDLVVMLEEPNLDAPRPWKVRAPGWLWELPRATSTVQLKTVAGQACAPMPAVATIGRGPDGPVMLDLEACGLVCIDGSTTEARALARSIALELAVSPIADSPRGSPGRRRSALATIRRGAAPACRRQRRCGPRHRLKASRRDGSRARRSRPRDDVRSTGREPRR